MVPRFDELARSAAGAFVVGDSRGAVLQNLAGARQLGLPALTVPAADGGMGANLLDFASYQGLIAEGDGATALVLAMHHMLVGGEAEGGAWPVAEWRELCGAVLDRGALVNSAATEPGTGSPSAGGLPDTSARPMAPSTDPAPGSSWRVRGRKAYTTGAPYLALMRVSARVEPADGAPYAARFLVRLPAEGMRFEDAWRPVALGAAANDDVVLDETPATFLYREDGRGCEGTVWFQVAIAATYLGIGFSAYRRAVEFTRGRTTAAGPVADREPVRLRLGRARGALDVARRNLLATCTEWVEASGGSDTRAGQLPAFGLAKVMAVNAAAAAAEEAMRLVGAGGYGSDQPFARLMLETRAGLSHPPVDDVAYLRLAAIDLD
jgi:alkylation response protein AidB-like acyl-CoA dehydrogenase